ncbi:MAG: hypothetical protein HZA11_07565 [Nitrospirae bacterium]|nr:hypothetical protein [Nitrospirota bacterium]
MVLAIKLREVMETMGSLKEKIGLMERDEIIAALKESNWIMARAARKLGITERMIGYKIKKYGIKEVRWIKGAAQEEQTAG